MSENIDIKIKLKDLVEQTVIPEVEAYLEDLHKLLEKNEQTDEDLEIIKDMESFLVELHNVIAVINENSLEDNEYENIFNKIMKNIKEHEH